VLSGEATHINFIVFGLTRSWLEPTIYRTREHANNYTIDAIYLCSTWTVQCHIIIPLPSRVLYATDGWCYVILLSSVLCYHMERSIY